MRSSDANATSLRVRLARRDGTHPPLDLASLPSRSVQALRQLWSVHVGRAEPPKQRGLLIRELAWRVQAKAQGGLDRSTQRLLQAAMRDAVREFARRRGVDGQEGGTTADIPGAPSDPAPRRRVRVQSAPDVRAGTRLVRVWNGRRHEVFAGGDGTFHYEGRLFQSLSELARAITGARWSGPRFFGLTRRVSPTADLSSKKEGH